MKKEPLTVAEEFTVFRFHVATLFNTGKKAKTILIELGKRVGQNILTIESQAERIEKLEERVTQLEAR